MRLCWTGGAKDRFWRSAVRFSKCVPCRQTLLAFVCMCASTCVLTACSTKSDSGLALEQRQREGERAIRGMQAATREIARGKFLVGDDLVAAVLGKTLVDRYDQRPDGRTEPYVIRRYFAAGGRYVFADQPPFESPMASDEDRWRIGRDALCIKGPPEPEQWKCYRLARADDGALQWFIAESGSPYDGLLTVVTREILDGPPSAAP
jgi:hypothetical protein